MNTFKRIVVAAMIAGATAVMPGVASADHMTGWGHMGPGMMGGYGYGMGPGMMGGWGMGPGMMGGYGYGMGPGMMWGPYGDVNLTDEQNAKIAAIQDEISKKQSDLMNQMQDEQFKLQQLYSAPTRDNAAFNKQLSRINQLRQQMWNNMADAQKKTDAVLTNEQRNTTRRWGGRHMTWGCW